jgi:hypothetical protein
MIRTNPDIVATSRIERLLRVTLTEGTVEQQLSAREIKHLKAR